MVQRHPQYNNRPVVDYVFLSLVTPPLLAGVRLGESCAKRDASAFLGAAQQWQSLSAWAVPVSTSHVHCLRCRCVFEQDIAELGDCLCSYSLLRRIHIQGCQRCSGTQRCVRAGHAPTHVTFVCPHAVQNVSSVWRDTIQQSGKLTIAVLCVRRHGAAVAQGDGPCSGPQAVRTSGSCWGVFFAHVRVC